MYRYYRAKSKEKVVIINISKEQNILFDLGTFSIHILNRIGNNFLSKLNYIKLKFLIAVIYDLHIFIDIIHLMSSFLWWSITFVVVLIVRPLNKTGNLSIILPKIQKIVLYASTVSIVSGFILFGINTDFQYYKLFYTWWGNVVLISGIFSLLVYFNILSGGGVRSIFIKLKMPKKFYNQTPVILFSMISISIILMILTSKVLLMVEIFYLNFNY